MPDRVHCALPCAAVSLYDTVCRFLGLVAYGVGITEALPLAAAELERVPVPADDGKEAKPCDVILLWASASQMITEAWFRFRFFKTRCSPTSGI